MSELTKKRVHWTEYNGEELLHDEDVDILTSADAVTFDDGEDLQYKYTQGQFVSPSVTGSLTNLSTTNKSTLVDAINEVKTNATSNESSIEDLGNRVTPISLGGTGATTASGALTNLGITATASELNYVDGVTSKIQTQLNNKQASITGGASTITSSNLTTSRALISNSSGKVAVSAVTSTELGYLDGVTSNVQTQLDEKANSSHSHSASNITSGILPIERGGTDASSASGAISNFKTAIVNLIYPVGSYYWSSSSTNPSTLFGGTWTQIKDRFVLAAGSSYSVGDTGGSETHTLTIDEMPSHSHNVGICTDTGGSGAIQAEYAVGNNFNNKVSTTSVGGGEPHNNMPPYIVAYCWRRTA